MSVSGLIGKMTGGRQEPDSQAGLPKILIVGTPNVGKSVLFNRLTGSYVTVSNYPGTTVELSRGRSRILHGHYEVIDTPGMYSLAPITEEERVACRMLLAQKAQAVLHVVDAKNISRMLGLTLQLIEADLPVVLVLNMADEARRLGVEIDTDKLRERLGVPVVETVATSGEGVGQLARAVRQAAPADTEANVDYGPELEAAIEDMAGRLADDGDLSVRTRALLTLQGEAAQVERIHSRYDPERAAEILQAASRARAKLSHSVHYLATLATGRAAKTMLDQAVTLPVRGPIGIRERLSRLCMHPLTGIPLLMIVLYFGLYKFVGEFGAGTVVDWLEGSIFEQHVNPWVIGLTQRVIPWPAVQDLLVGDYGILTLGVRYAVAIVLPIVGAFFIAFSVLEDSGYLPRLAMLIDRLFKKIGLNGRAVIPMVLGFGCGTMATMVTRTLESKREKVIASMLLALAIPCSAQLGVIMALLVGHAAGLLVWAGVVGGMLVLAGSVAARIMPGTGPSFYMELPPLRLPRPVNVLVKTYSRMVWYFKEILPLFVLASVAIWLGQITGVFDWLVNGLKPAVRTLGLPDQSAVAFLFGFFRRDYGAAGLHDIQDTLSGNQLTVAAITLTLFLPCVAQFLIFKKEHGWLLSVLTGAGVLAIAFTVGLLVHLGLDGLGVQL